MKTWVIIVLILVFIFVVVPLIYFGITAYVVSKEQGRGTPLPDNECSNLQLMAPPPGKTWVCRGNSWELVNI